MVIRGVVFDIDDTLFLERDYVRSGFNAIARLLAQTPEECGDIAAWLWDAFARGVRGDTFDRLLAARPDLASRSSAPQLVSAYRAHTPEIALLPGMQDVVGELVRRGMRLGVLSDGPVASQRAKATALGLDAWFDPVILTEACGPGYPKPGRLGFERIAQAWQLPGEQLAYVADNPLKDFGAPRALGWRTIRLRMPQQLSWAVEAPDPGDRADLEVGRPEEILAQLA